MKRICISILYLSIISVALYAQCIDFTDLRSSKVRCTYGTFDNPYETVGLVDDGPKAGSSRHTIHTDVSEKDPRTNNQLSTVPPGERASVRLGNWSTGSQAESITYEYNVDAEENPVLVFKYAAVMQNPDHQPDEQPRLTLEILDSNNEMVDSYCGAFDFIASESLGWNTQDKSGILWKDWTAVGLDLSNYSGQTIYIRFTTYDCSHGGHYGYAYLNISCQQKKIQSLTCGRNNQTTLSGPDGFEYKWYTLENGSKNIVGTSQSITVPTDETLYYCEVNQTGKPTCSFVMNAKADSRLPLANFAYQRKGTCVDTLYLTNLSGVSRDGQLVNVPQEDCDEYIWDLGDGRIIHSKDINQPITYDNTDTYKVTLTAILKNGNCEHVCERNIFMHGYNDSHTEHIYDTICSNEYVMFGADRIEKDGTYTHVVGTTYGCDSTFILHLRVNPSYYFEEPKAICDYEVYNYRGKLLNKTGIYKDTFYTQNGCDSIYALNLQVRPTHKDTVDASICLGEYYVFGGNTLYDNGIYLDTLADAASGDCEIRTLRLRTVASTIISNAQVDDACADDTTYQIKYQYTGPAPVSYSLYYDKNARMMGFKDVHDAPFTGYVYDTIPYFANNSYIRPDWYNVRVEFNNGTCAPSQSAYELSFMVKYPSWILEQNWNDVVAVLNADYNGGYDFKQFDWFVNDKLFSENSKSYLYAPQYFHNGDMVYAQLTRSNEDYPICTCPIVLRDMSAEYVSEEPILISVNKIQRKLRIFTQEKLTGGIYDIYGHLIQPFSVMQAGESYVTIHNANSGVYIVKCTSATKEQSYKFVL